MNKSQHKQTHTHTYREIFKIWVPWNVFLEVTYLIAQVQTPRMGTVLI